ncbi:MAG: lactonase family protein [Planctomycetota bacterium]|nr:lactonase family protein [Planctomycetota bacterium]
MNFPTRFLFFFLLLAFAGQIHFCSAEEIRFFVGTYTGGQSRGIYSATLNTETGKVSKPELVAEMTNPSFLAIHPGNGHLYAVGETTDYGGQKSGSVAAFSIQPETGRLTLLNERPSRGGAPCHLVVNREGTQVLFANYVGGNVGTLPILANGSLGEKSFLVQHQGSSVTPRQQGPHAHSINLDAKNNHAVAADLGLDKLITYRLTNAGKLIRVAEHSETPGAGPRHFVFHPNGRFGYLLNEMNATVSALSYAPQSGKFESLQTLPTLPGEFKGRKSCAEVRIHPTGKFLYCSNRGHDSIAVYQILDSGKMKRVEIIKTGGQEPRNFVLDPSGKFLLAENQKSDSITVFKIHPTTGRLTASGQPVYCPTPVCIRFLNTKKTD